MGIKQELASVTPKGATLLTIGVFDGVHAGHRYLLEELQQQATKRDLLSGVVTFNPHPQSVLHPSSQLPGLTGLEDRVSIFRSLGINMVAVLTFTLEVAQLSAREFVSLAKKYLCMRGMIVGHDFALGQGKEGDIDHLRALGYEMGFTVDVVPPFQINDEVVSSTLIRLALSKGDVRKVTELMGRYFYLEGKVITHERRGQILGFPTANLDIRPHQALPGHGSYATIARVDSRSYYSATNIGIRPTFGPGEEMLETHLLNYEGNLYGKDMRVEFVQKLRDEKRFNSFEELKAQIGKDIKEVEAILARDLK